MMQWKQGAVAGSHMVTLVSRCQLTVQTYSGQSSHEKPSQTKFELNQTNTNGFNWFQFQFQKFWLKLNSLVSGLGKNGLNQTKPNFPNTSVSTGICRWLTPNVDPTMLALCTCVGLD